MPVQFHQNLNIPKMEPTGSQSTCYGHPRRQATKCKHVIHASASQHTPLCPTCIDLRSKATMNAALKGLVAEGGLVPPEHLRNRRWQRAKRRFEITKQRQEKVRCRDQLREEQEQAWEEAHQRFNLQRSQPTTTSTELAECPACAAMIAAYSTEFSATDASREVAWWERPGGLVAHHILVRSSPLRRVRQMQRSLGTVKPSSKLSMFIRDLRRAMAESDADRLAWETRYRTESAVRRKHGMGEQYRFEPDFWDAPISASLSRQYYQQAKDDERMAIRRARGNTQRPKPPRSSLSYSERSEEIEVDAALLEQTWKAEEQESLERQARKVGEEVGYLYFVGEIDGLLEWREDFLKSDRALVYRKLVPKPKPSEDEEHGSDTEEDTDDSEENKSDEDEVSSEEMDIDE
jgi:hypothetical protein